MGEVYGMAQEVIEKNAEILRSERGLINEKDEFDGISKSHIRSHGIILKCSDFSEKLDPFEQVGETAFPLLSAKKTSLHRQSSMLPGVGIGPYLPTF